MGVEIRAVLGLFIENNIPLLALRSSPHCSDPACPFCLDPSPKWQGRNGQPLFLSETSLVSDDGRMCWRVDGACLSGQRSVLAEGTQHLVTEKWFFSPRLLI